MSKVKRFLYGLIPAALAIAALIVAAGAGNEGG